MKTYNRGALTGAAFLMATSAIGPGFLTQTTLFTKQLGAAFGFAILISILLDILVQLNIWRVISVSGKPAQNLANAVMPGLGYALSLLIVFGGLAFNIGNIAGAGLGLNVIFGMDVLTGAIASSVFAVAIFLVKEAGVAMDKIAKALGIVMIVLMIYVAWSSGPPLATALKQSFFPDKVDFTAILTIVGGTVGGYISFSGAHRLLDAGIVGTASIPRVNRSAIMAVSIASLMRILLFLGALGVVVSGAGIDASNPAASVFRLAAGNAGYRLFGIILWAAAITSVIGSAYTSVSFVRNFHVKLHENQKWVTVVFISISSVIFILVGQPVRILVLAGTLNGLVLPVALAIILLAAHNKKIAGNYHHPKWLTISGIAVIVIMSYMGFRTLMLMMQPAA